MKKPPDQTKDPGGYAVWWINNLTHTKGEWAGQPFNLRPWQEQKIVRPLFGTLNPDRTRRYRLCYVEIPRKNGKTELVAALALYMLCGDNEAGAEVYCLDPATRVLHADDLSWRAIGDVQVGDSLFAIDEQPPQDEAVFRRRRMRRAKVLRVEHRKAFRLRLTMANGQELICTPQHRWWVSGPAGSQQGWRRAGSLDRGWRIKFFGAPWRTDTTYGGGYLAGLFDGEGFFHDPQGDRSAFRIAFGQKPGPVLDAGLRELRERGFPAVRYPGDPAYKGHVDEVYVAGIYPVLRFLGEIRPARLLPRHEEIWKDRSIAKGFHDVPIERIEFLHEGPVVDIETDARTFLAEGFVSHNSAACDLEQSSLAFNVAAQMVRNDEELSRHLEVVPSRKRIIHKKSGSFYRAIPADAPSAHGYNASAILADELHAWRTRALWDVLTTSQGARRQPLIVVITTAGWDRTTICWEQHDYASKVRDGIIQDPTYLPVLYGAHEDADWEDEKVWAGCNPALGDFRAIDEMRAYHARAREVPALQNTFRQLYLCQWTQQARRALDMRVWDEAATPALSIDSGGNLDGTEALGLRGRDCYAGLDLASTTDLAALALVFPLPRGRYAVVPRLYIPEGALKGGGVTPRDAHLAEILEQWGREGFLTITPGKIIDYDRIRADVNALNRQVHICEIAIDRWNAAQITTQLLGDGFTVIEFGQGFAHMSAPTKDLIKLHVGRELLHGGHPVLRWMAANFAVAQDAQGNLKPDKANSSEKIDGIVATIMGLARASLHPVIEAEGEVLMGPPRATASMPW